MDKKRQLRMLGWAALIPLFVLVWILSAESPSPPANEAPSPSANKDAAAETAEEALPEIAEQPAGLSQGDKDSFRDWVIRDTIVTELDYPEGRDDHLRIRLEKEKYTTQEAAEKIAFYLVRYYKMETGFVDPVTLTILYPDKSEVFFEGRY